MRTVEMRLQPNELSGLMAAMRIWLDERRFEPSSFSCRECGAGVLVRVNFKVAEEAEAFAQRFGGSVDAALAQLARNGAGPMPDAEAAALGKVG